MNLRASLLNAYLPQPVVDVIEQISAVAQLAFGKARATYLPVQGVVMSNVADLTAFTVAGPYDGQAFVAGDRILLANQTTGSQNGIYVVGTVAAGVAPLTRSFDMATGSLIIAGSIVPVVAGTLFAETDWRATVTTTAGSGNPAHFPVAVALQATLVAGELTVSGIPLVASNYAIVASRAAVGGTVTATVQYVTGLTATVTGKAAPAFTLNAAVNAGTINVADTSTLAVIVRNF
jgi:hypothetical protein